MATAHHPAEAAVRIREIGVGDLKRSLAQGWDDFLDRRGDIIFIGLIYPLIGLIAATVMLGGSLLPMFFPIAAGISLLGPVVAIGFYELARRRESKLECDWSHFFDVVHRPSRGAIALVTLVLLAIFAAWIAAAAGLYSMLLGGPPATIGEFLTELFTTREGLLLIVVGNLVGFGFAAIVLTLSVVSLPMLVDRDVDAKTALETSIRAVLANKWVMMRWGLIVATLLVVGSISLFIGLAVVLPVLGYATWHLYTCMVER